MYQIERHESFLLEKLREECLKRGAAGIKGIGRMWRQIDNERRGTISIEEFQEGITNHNINFTPQESAQLFEEIDKNGNGFIDYNEFLLSLRAPMKPKRVDMVVKVFKKLDKNLSGEVTIDDLIDVYDVSKNPRFLNGEMSQEKCLKQFLEHFEANLHCDGIVTFNEFLDYYSGVSAGIDQDSYFDVMLRHSWNL